MVLARTLGLQSFLHVAFSRAFLRQGKYPAGWPICADKQPPELSRSDALRHTFKEAS